MLAQFLDEQVGIEYVPEQAESQRQGVKEFYYTDPADLFLHGLIDRKTGTCATMPTLHVAIGRRLGWPVSLACVKSHYVCRYDDGQAVYNIETTDTGRGGFAAGTDAAYARRYGLSKIAITSGSDLRQLTAREMLGVFIGSRARLYADTGRSDLAARDYALAHSLVPTNRKIYVALVGHLMNTGTRLFTENEHGHPRSLAAFLSATMGTQTRQPGPGLAVTDVERINAMNQARMQQAMQPPPPAPTAPSPAAPTPGLPTPPSPHAPH